MIRKPRLKSDIIPPSVLEWLEGIHRNGGFTAVLETQDVLKRIPERGSLIDFLVAIVGQCSDWTTDTIFLIISVGIEKFDNELESLHSSVTGCEVAQWIGPVIAAGGVDRSVWVADKLTFLIEGVLANIFNPELRHLTG